MENIKLGMVESCFADLIWQNEPVSIKNLVALCEKELNWKRTTTYTVLKKLCDRGIFITQDRMVTSLLSKSEFHAIQSEQFVNDNFQGSLPAFIAAFTTRATPTAGELEEIKRLMAQLEENS